MIDNKTIRDHIILKKMFPGSINPYDTRTASGAIASFNTNYAAPLESCILEINPLQSGTGDPSPTNPRPITGFTGATVHVADGESPHVIDNTYPLALGRTVYGGSLNVTTGELVVSYGYVDMGDLEWSSENISQTGLARAYVNSYSPAFKWGGGLFSSKFKFNPTIGWNGLSNGDIALTNAEIFPILRIRWEDWATYTDAQIKAALSGTQCIYELATPQTYQLTPTEIATLLGENNIWHDANGETNVSYLYQTGEGGGINNKTFLPFFYPIRKGDL